ncbi:MAG: acyl carrier protein [Pirellulaceae bacterium]|nr:acyl carrier protein [Planctomycetales bacterium]
MTRAELEQRIIAAIKSTIAESTGKAGAAVTIDSKLDRGSIGLDSLGWATVIVRLEAELGADPFRTESTRGLQTVSDIVDLYQKTLETQS